MGDWSELFFDENGIEIFAEGFIMGADSNVIVLHVAKQVDEESWSIEGSEEFLTLLQDVSDEFKDASNESEEFYYYVITKGRAIYGGEKGANAEVLRLKSIAEKVFDILS